MDGQIFSVDLVEVCGCGDKGGMCLCVRVCAYKWVSVFGWEDEKQMIKRDKWSKGGWLYRWERGTAGGRQPMPSIKLMSLSVPDLCVCLLCQWEPFHWMRVTLPFTRGMNWLYWLPSTSSSYHPKDLQSPLPSTTTADKNFTSLWKPLCGRIFVFENFRHVRWTKMTSAIITKYSRIPRW